MKTGAKGYFERVLNQLTEFGLLLESDPTLPSVCTLITGERLRGSWWSHPLAEAIFQVNCQLEDHPDVIVTKLISEKVTFAHRKLWPAILAIGEARESWQTQSLSAPANSVLHTVDREGSQRTDKLPWPKSLKGKPGDVARELEKKLLVHSEQIHTETGAHAKLLESWKHWAERIRPPIQPLSTDSAKTRIEHILQRLNDGFAGKGKLPWT